jgi:hypothetical protein
LTSKQQAVSSLRYDRGATIEQIASWLKITRRAVFYRLRNARLRAALSQQNQGSSYPAVARTGRLYSASQITTAARSEYLNLDEV